MIDATVVGAGPNGLAAAVTLARAGLQVRLVERADTVGGGMRSAELTLPGHLSDVCSAVHPAALASPFFRAFGLTQRVDFVIPELSYAHPLDGGRAGLAWRDLERTAEGLGPDGDAWRRLFAPILEHLDGVVDFTGSQLLRVPRDPVATVTYGLRVLEQGTGVGRLRFADATAPAMLAGVAAHAGRPVPSLPAAGAGLLLAAHAHARGWGYPRGGSQAIAEALASDFLAHGGRLDLGVMVRSRADLEPSRAILLDTSARFLDEFAGDALPARYRRRLAGYRYGVGAAKVDFALSSPVPWEAEAVRLAPTVHLGGTAGAISRAERLPHKHAVAARPYVLLCQPSVLDPTRAPDGHHMVWAYIHVPRGSSFDPTETVTAQIERFAPGFRDLVLASSAHSARQLAEYNPNYLGGDILGGALSLTQLFRRPVTSPTPWRTPVEGLYLCSAATPPGPAVHGMNGWYAATLALRDVFGIRHLPSLAAS
ncbi:NAD(P)/FAD-dependent oxidoreductase [Diaminobutyricimonas sp. TR449]|uniref:phytoene desaturase family protein n=1 Tax=Diaminobutyricimonas sp. TR449 TaxID=2708076 RepID=UPI001423551D|nr:NAD(P)/FAD-dependent oxidoreductase [Diaminobutyricimonas sp. TR449]